jgi:hypothetical protein
MSNHALTHPDLNRIPIMGVCRVAPQHHSIADGAQQCGALVMADSGDWDDCAHAIGFSLQGHASQTANVAIERVPPRRVYILTMDGLLREA